MISMSDTISDVTLDDIKEYVRESDNSSATNRLLEQIMSSALGYIISYTGLALYEIDSIPEMVAVYKVLAADMYDNRSFVVESDKINPFVLSILDMHRVNLVL